MTCVEAISDRTGADLKASLLSQFWIEPTHPERERIREMVQESTARDMSAVLICLQDAAPEPMKASKISRRCEISRHQTNQALYALLREANKVEKIGDAPPMWQAVVDSQMHICADSDGVLPLLPRTIVVVDLGNTHDCLQNLLLYATRKEIEVYAYADLAFNGYGVNPPLIAPNVKIHQATDSHRNSADTKLIWDLASLTAEHAARDPQRELQIIVATRDLGFQTLQTLVAERERQTLTFVQDWSTLRLYIEG